jgi:trans-aconitate methyltransferase
LFRRNLLSPSSVQNIISYCRAFLDIHRTTDYHDPEDAVLILEFILVTGRMEVNMNCQHNMWHQYLGWSQKAVFCICTFFGQDI